MLQYVTLHRCHSEMTDNRYLMTIAEKLQLVREISCVNTALADPAMRGPAARGAPCATR